jgi:hypothetical protein
VYNRVERRAATESIVLSIRWVSTPPQRVLDQALSGRAAAHELSSRNAVMPARTPNAR